jgi:hypothetical protein
MKVQLKHSLKEDFDSLKYQTESDIKVAVEDLNQTIVSQNRFMSDIRVTQCELENYIEKYLPYNCQVETLKMLN